MNYLALIGLLLATVFFVLSLIFMWSFSTYDWRLWPAIYRAKRQMKRIVNRYSSQTKIYVRQGSTRVDPREIAFWIATISDEDRDRLRLDSNLLQELRDALQEAGYPRESISTVHFLVESQETVDRDYGGSWRESMEMP